ncbi:coiled-coil domain-containing protein 27-like [Chiloscyllium plagiosum]|uniref:coiled-coil domain-containing protein 27-like n=1 Tax=Chiloscyllium plagiosum TaxID=36176 RepID=UPI001CB7C8FA|nr:coiled-coil domain-containing protein 27-like [Chiloscyllium plagiosum]
MIHEKEKCVLMLEEKVKKLSHFEAESLRKDDIIKSLQAEITDLNQQLKKASDINTIKSQAETIIALQEKIETFKEMEAENKRKDSIINKLRDEIWQQGLQISHLRFDSSIHFSDSALEDTFRSMTIDHELTTRPEISKAVVEKLSEEMLAQEEDEAGDDSIKIVVNQMEDEVGEEEMMDLGAMAHTPEFLDYDEPSEVEVEDEKQEELERLNNRNEKLRVKLREVKVHYNMARGAIISINRKWSWAEAELRKKDAEMERVQKELKDRCNQLLDMSNKFSNLRERNNHTKIMTDLQKENISLRELVAELQSGQTVNNEEIVKLKTEINKLQLHITAEDVRKRHLQAEFDKATSQGEVMQRELQDLQIALKFTGTRLERFISKIVQAVYTAPGIVQPTTQITDEDTLEMFQVWSFIKCSPISSGSCFWYLQCFTQDAP